MLRSIGNKLINGGSAEQILVGQSEHSQILIGQRRRGVNNFLERVMRKVASAFTICQPIKIDLASVSEWIALEPQRPIKN